MAGAGALAFCAICRLVLFKDSGMTSRVRMRLIELNRMAAQNAAVTEWI
jgi:hypothetical protein